MKEKLYTLLFFLLVTISGKAQDFNPGPEAQNLTERKNVTVDYATGLFHYTVPLYQLKSGDYELPISLDYIAKGVKVSDPEGLIGKNWTLNVGGIVTRTMRCGFADEKSGYGYLCTENAVTPLEQDARTVGLRKRDGESDIFTVVFNGKKVDFIIRMNEKRQIYALPLGQTDVRIECEGTSTEITGWTITDNNGNFQLSDVPKDSRVRISYVGLETQFLNPSSYMSVVMKSDTKALDEVVVTGMFNRKKEGFTGSAVTIKGEDLKKYSTNNVAKAIAAVAPGLRIMDNINMGSNPNNLPDMRMRGGANMDMATQSAVDFNSTSNDVLAVQG